MRKHLLAAALLLAPFIFMGGQCNPAGTTPEELRLGTLTADLGDGSSYICDAATAKKLGSKVSVVGIQNIFGGRPDEMVLDIPVRSSVPYTVVMPGGESNTLVEYCLNVGSSCRQFYARQGQGACSITVTSLMADSIRGSFTATVVDRNSSTDSVRTISSGQFNVRITQ